MDKPVVYVLMAIYNPDLIWLKEQLISINNQDYENINLLVCDDCSTSITENKFILIWNNTLPVSHLNLLETNQIKDQIILLNGLLKSN